MYPEKVGHWSDDAEVASKDGRTFEKSRPSDDAVIAQVARGGAAEVSRALASAAAAAPEWSR